MRHSFKNVVHTISNAFKVSLTNSFPVTQEKNFGQTKGEILLVISVDLYIYIYITAGCQTLNY